MEENDTKLRRSQRANLSFIHSSLDDAGLKPSPFRIYCHIARRCGSKATGACYESLGNMAKACGLSDDTARDALKTLLRQNMITKEEVAGAPSIYRLTDPETWKGVGKNTRGEHFDRHDAELEAVAEAMGWVDEQSKKANTHPKKAEGSPRKNPDPTPPKKPETKVLVEGSPKKVLTDGRCLRHPCSVDEVRKFALEIGCYDDDPEEADACVARFISWNNLNEWQTENWKGAFRGFWEQGIKGHGFY